jgi:geranylgeranyl pyrophosphate synthase
MPSDTIEAELARHARRVDPLLEELIPRQGPAFLAEPAWYHMDTGGKRLRPALCLLACEALGGDSEKALYFAAAVELLHNMFLVHDDLEDGDTMRRNKPTVWKTFGEANAINVGDYLLGRAMRAVTLSPVSEAVRARLIGLFVATYERTVEGQALDINARCSERFGEEDYLRMAELKTGHYLVLGMMGSAVIAEASEATLECFRRLGSSLGPAFQVRDDLIDLTHGKGRGGVVGSDILEGKASILYAHALAHSSPMESERLLEVMRKPREETTAEDVSWVLGLYEQCGSMRFARATADCLIAEALEELETLPVEQRPRFRRIVEFIAERTT